MMANKTGIERQKLYRESNEQGVKLAKLKFAVKTSQKRASDNAYNDGLDNSDLDDE